MDENGEMLPNGQNGEVVGMSIETRRQNTVEIQRWAARSYRPQPYGGRIVLFQCSARRGDSLAIPDLAGAILPSVAYEMPGDHRDMLEDPVVNQLAQELRASLVASGGAPQTMRVAAYAGSQGVFAHSVPAAHRSSSVEGGGNS